MVDFTPDPVGVSFTPDTTPGIDFIPEEPDGLGERIGGAFVRGAMRLGGAMVDLPKHIVNQVKLVPMATMADEVLAARDPKERAAKLKDMGKLDTFFNIVTDELGKAGELHRIGQETILKNHPEWESEPPESFIDLFSSPDKLAVSLAESTPLLLGAGIMTAAGAPNIAAMMMYASEGQEAYDRAIADGASEEDAEMAYTVYAPIAAALETMQLHGIMRIGKGFYNQILNRTAQKVARRGAKALVMDVIKVAAKESLEEAAQGEWGDVTANIIYDEPFSDIGTHIDRRAQEAYIGFTMGLIPAAGGAAAGSMQRVVTKPEAVEEPTEVTPAVTEEKVKVSKPEDVAQIGLKGLAAEAKKYDTFEKFEKAWLRETKHGLYWHVTYEPSFQIDTSKGPRDMSSMAAGRMDVGKLMITSDLPYWAEGYMDIEETGGKPRGYAAIIDMSNVPKKAYYQVKRGFGNEFYVSEPSLAKVVAVLPIEKALAFDEAYDAVKPENIKELRKFYEQHTIKPAPTKPATADEAIGKQYGLVPEETNERLGKAELRYRKLKNKPVNERTNINKKELAFLKRNRNDIEAILDRETKPIEKTMSRKKALAIGHDIPKQLGWTEDQRRDFNKRITNQRSMKGMVPAQRQQIVTALMKEAKAAGIEIDGPDSSPIADLTMKLEERKQKPALTQRDRRNMKKLRKIFYTMKSKTNFYFLHMSRMKRLCSSLDNYETDGPFTQNIYQPVKDADTKSAVKFSATMDAAQRTFEDLDIDVPGMFSEVKDIGIEDKLSTAERIGVWALAQNAKTKNHLLSEFTKEEIGKIAKSVEDNEKEMLVAAEIQTYFETGWDQLKAIAEAHGIKGIVKEENYITAFVKNKQDVTDTEFMEGLLQEFTQGKFVPGEQHTIERKPGAKRNLELNIFMIHARAAKTIERFKVMAPTADKVGQMLKHGSFKEGINNATYGHGSRLFDKWLQDSIRGQSVYDTSPIGQALRWLRMRSVHYVLGAKILTAAKQGLSMVPAMGVHPGMAPLILANIAHNPFGAKYKAMEAEVMSKSDMMRHRDWDRDLRQTYDKKAIKKMYAGKKLSPLLMRMATWVDRHTAGSVWYAAYQLSQRQGMNEKESIRFANGVVEKTQPMGKAVDLPAFFRGSELEKNLTIFQNQVNQNGNMLWYDVLGETKARKISMPMLSYRLLMQQVIPALMLGMIARGRLPRTPGDIIKDLAFYLMSPYFFIGRFLYNTFIAREWGPTTGFIWETPFTETFRATGAVMKGDVGKAIKYGTRAVGAWTGGYPPLQVIQTVEGGWNLATGETDDFRELIWSKYALKTKEKKRGPRKGF